MQCYDHFMSFFERLISKRGFLPETQTDATLKNFTIVGGNSSLTQSNIVFVGETHNQHWLESAEEEALRDYSQTIVLSEGSSRDTASLLREIIKPGDIVLLEALENGSEVLPGSVQ